MYECILQPSLHHDSSHTQANLVHSSGQQYPISQHLSIDNLCPNHACFTTFTIQLDVPKTYKEAIKHIEWRRAMRAELMYNTWSNHTWILTPLPAGKNIVGCKWFQRIKYKSYGSLERYKARHVAKGYTQEEGLYYFGTFSHVTKLTTLRTLLVVASIKNWHYTS